MLTFLVLASLALATVAGGILAVPFLVVGGVLWLVLLPVRIVFNVAIGLLGALVSLLMVPVVLLVVALSLAGAAVVAVLSLAAPLLPLALLIALVWGVYRIAVPRPS